MCCWSLLTFAGRSLVPYSRCPQLLEDAIQNARVGHDDVCISFVVSNKCLLALLTPGGPMFATIHPSYVSSLVLVLYSGASLIVGIISSIGHASAQLHRGNNLRKFGIILEKS